MFFRNYAPFMTEELYLFYNILSFQIYVLSIKCIKIHGRLGLLSIFKAKYRARIKLCLRETLIYISCKIITDITS